MFRFIHASDLHIDSPLRGLELKPGAPAGRIREATRQAFHNITSLCLEEGVAFMLIAGDVFDGDWRDFNTGLFFLRELGRLREADIRVFLVRGNHDAASEITRRLPWPEHVREFPAREPESVRLDAHGVAIHGMSYAQAAMTDNLVPRYPAPVRDHLNIGLLHTSAGGHPDHATYAPCSIAELVGKGYQYWALGHVHERAVLHQEPWIVFPGNPQGRHARESGPRSVTLVSVIDGQVAAAEPIVTDVVRFTTVTVALDADDDRARMLERARLALHEAMREADGHLVAARLRLVGACRAHAEIEAERAQTLAELEAEAIGLGEDLWLERVQFLTTPAVDLASLRESGGLVGTLLRRVRELNADPAAARAAIEEMLRPIVGTAPTEAQEFGRILDPTEVLAQAEALVAARLQEAAE